MVVEADEVGLDELREELAAERRAHAATAERAAALAAEIERIRHSSSGSSKTIRIEKKPGEKGESPFKGFGLEPRGSSWSQVDSFKVTKEGPAWRAGVRDGMEIRTINGRPWGKGGRPRSYISRIFATNPEITLEVVDNTAPAAPVQELEKENMPLEDDDESAA